MTGVSLIDRSAPLRVMMIGPYPQSPDRIDGGAASAVTYLSQGLVAVPGVELIGVRTSVEGAGSLASEAFDWPTAEITLGGLGLSTLYRRQKHQLARLLERFRPDIVHGQGVDLAGFLAVGCGLPSVVTVHGILGETAKYQASRVARARGLLTSRLIERHIVRCATELISISPYVTQHYGRNFKGRVHEIPNAVTSRYFDVRRAPERGRLLFAGRITRLKGVVDLVRAVGRHRETVSKLVLAGNAPDKDYERLVRQEVERQGLVARVEFTGLLAEPALLDEFSRAEALVLPSYQETAPMVVQQAMAAGLAVLASNICGVPYQIEDGVSGLLFEAGAVDQLAALLARLDSDPSLSQRLGEAAKATAESRFRASTVAGATYAAYRVVLARAGTRAPRFEKLCR